MNGFECEFIMGDLPQQKRLRIIDDVKAGKIRFLVATDVAARGLDIEGLAMVVNYDLPNESENYVHRIGRTARAGKTGKAFTLATEQDVYELPPIERYIGGKIPSETVTAEMLAEDESEGKRIQTDYYEDRRAGFSGAGSSGARGGGGRSGGSGGRGRRDEGRSGGARRGERDGRGRSARADGSQDGGARRDGGARKQHSGQRGVPRGGVPHTTPHDVSPVNLSALSAEERMAYYKQKYGKGAGQPQSGGGELRTGRTDGGGNQRDRNRRNRGRGRDAQGREAQGRRTAPGNASAHKPAGAAAPDKTAAGKKGILSKLFGLFKKK